MRIQLDQGWQVFQDHFDAAEQCRIYEDRFDPTVVNCGYEGGTSFQMDEWRSIPSLKHLQLLLSEDPQLAPEMRLYNAAPWWYRVCFECEADVPEARVRFGGVDYYCKVWLNGAYLGAHEGYQTAFAFDASLRKGKNVLYVKVWSPLDFGRIGDIEESRCLMVERTMMKGLYEHGDSLLHRDRNPVGIWREVIVESREPVEPVERIRIDARTDGSVRVTAKITNKPARNVPAKLVIRDVQTGLKAAEAVGALDPAEGVTTVILNAKIEKPRLWNTWDRGGAYLYEAKLSIGDMTVSERFGIRSAALERTEEKTTYYLNGKRLYIRGASYYTEAYLSLMSEGRVRRDLELLKQGGCNAVRVHVHREIPEFYDLCDEMGILVMQDTDFNWVHPVDDAWTARALKIVRDELIDLHNHPSIVTWILMNEPVEPGQPEMGRYCADNRFIAQQPGPQLASLFGELEPDRSCIWSSYSENDLRSGDSHNYTGSIDGPVHYLERAKMAPEKLNTEFGFDAAPSAASLLRYPKIYRKLDKTDDELEAIQYYQYRFLKYCIEGYRLKKYAPTSGHVQFMLADCSPMSYYGVIDYWGAAKRGYQAFEESNKPLGAFLRVEETPSLWIVNDFDRRFEGARIVCTVLKDGETAAVIDQTVDIEADSIAEICPVAFDKAEGVYSAEICVFNADGGIICRNRYDDLYNHPEHPEGHPIRFSNTYGIRLY